MKKMYLFICIMGIVFGSSAYTTKSIINKIRKQYLSEKTFSADMEQRIYWSVREKTGKKKGAITIAPENKFHIELGHETYVSNGAICWHYSSISKQVVIRKIDKAHCSFNPSNLLNTFIEGYSFTASDNHNETIELEAIDTASSADYKRICLTVAAKKGEVKKLQYIDGDNNQHTYIFKKTVFKKTFDPSLFNFKVPADATVIDHRK